jgi:hypothetical protein
MIQKFCCTKSSPASNRSLIVDAKTLQKTLKKMLTKTKIKKLKYQENVMENVNYNNKTRSPFDIVELKYYLELHSK